MDKNNIIQKVEKLLNLANDTSASQGEIENATKAANKLMMKYQLSSDDILLGYSEVSSEVIEAFPKSSEYQDWLWDLLNVISVGNMCSTYAKKHRVLANNRKGYMGNGWYVTVVGSDLNRRIVTQMYNTCSNMFPKLALSAWKSTLKGAKDNVTKYLLENDMEEHLSDITQSFLVKKGIIPSKRLFINSYYKGAMQGLNKKFNENLKELPQDELHKWGLMVVKNDTLLEDYINENEEEIGKHRGRKTKIDARAFIKGEDDAKHIDQKQIG